MRYTMLEQVQKRTLKSIGLINLFKKLEYRAPYLNWPATLTIVIGVVLQ